MRTTLSLRIGVAALAIATAAAPAVLAAQAPGDDPQLQADVQKALDKKQFSNVKVAVTGGVVMLTGSVRLYADKEDADKRAHKPKGVHAVENDIEVQGGAEISDQQLFQKLAEKLAYDRVGYGTTAFNALTLAVTNGVVTLGGVAYGPMDKASAVSLVENYPGVRDVVDNIEVAPTSPNDDRIRIAEARAIYGAPNLNKYAIDPVKPIRITVVNGNVTLTGTVNNKMDRDVAGIRANGVPGVFKVTNNLEVAGQQGGSR